MVLWLRSLRLTCRSAALKNASVRGVASPGVGVSTIVGEFSTGDNRVSSGSGEIVSMK